MRASRVVAIFMSPIGQAEVSFFMVDGRPHKVTTIVAKSPESFLFYKPPPGQYVLIDSDGSIP